MKEYKLNEETVKAAVFGGAVLGGGGGGWIKSGMKFGQLALEVGHPRLIPINELSNDDLVATVTIVGAPAAKKQYVKPVYYINALNLLKRKFSKDIVAINTNENGASTTINGLFQSAITGLPVIDAPCNGRAHPTAIMGSMSLATLENYTSHQVAIGGKDENYIEASLTGAFNKVSSLVRNLSVEAGGMVAVARDPVPVSYIKENGAPGAIKQAIQIGNIIINSAGEESVHRIAEYLNGQVIVSDTVTHYNIATKGGFDVGLLKVGNHELTFWNEYMTLENKGERLASFPDLIMTFDTNTGKPLISAEIQTGQSVTVLKVPKDNLILGSTMRNKEILKTIEPVIGKKIIN